jgi:hypothetical protein
MGRSSHVPCASRRPRLSDMDELLADALAIHQDKQAEKDMAKLSKPRTRAGRALLEKQPSWSAIDDAPLFRRDQGPALPSSYFDRVGLPRSAAQRTLSCSRATLTPCWSSIRTTPISPSHHVALVMKHASSTRSACN